MATFYVGVRPVLKGRNESEFSNPIKRLPVGTYSYYPNFGPGLLTGAPDNQHEVGEGDYPYGLAMSRRFRGDDTKSPLDAPGLGARLVGFRFHPLENKAAGNNLVFSDGYGHADRDVEYASFNNNLYQGLTGARVLATASLGHGLREYGEDGVANSFGSFQPDVPHGINQALPTATLGQALPETHDESIYGHNKVGEWFGVPSAAAL